MIYVVQIYVINNHDTCWGPNLIKERKLLSAIIYL